jgi:ABC-type uncharacterized transport system ATPase subunit
MGEVGMNPSEDFSRLYTDISDSIATAMAEIADLKVEHKDGKKEITNIMERLRAIQERFDGELSLLEENAEWDKFTIAFFGETNAGKSTILESLRILFKEESRQLLLQQNEQDLAKYEQALTYQINQVRNGLNRVCAEYVAEIEAIKKSAAALALVLKDESVDRNRILQEESSSRIKRKLWLFAIGGFSVGGIVAGGVVFLFGRLL